MTPHETARDEAVAWLVGRLRFERLLASLHGDAVEAPEQTRPAAKAA